MVDTEMALVVDNGIVAKCSVVDTSEGGSRSESFGERGRDQVGFIPTGHGQEKVAIFDPRSTQSSGGTAILADDANIELLVDSLGSLGIPFDYGNVVIVQT